MRRGRGYVWGALWFVCVIVWGGWSGRLESSIASRPVESRRLHESHPILRLSQESDSESGNWTLSDTSDVDLRDLFKDELRGIGDESRHQSIDAKYLDSVPPKGKSCIALLVRGQSDEIIKSFVNYHRAIGFDWIFIFFDDPEMDEQVIRAAKSWNRVSVYECTPTFWREEKIRDPEYFKVYEPHLNTEVMARQCIVVARAIADALDMGIDWLLHIDVDEALLVKDVKEFLQYIPANASQIRCLNWEAAVETDEVKNWFREVELFKINPKSIDKEILDQAWPLRKGQSVFMGYDCGKAFVRVKSGVVPRGVHAFGLRNESVSGFRDNDTIFEDGTNQHQRPGGSAIVLHYINAGFQNWERKYKLLGNFSDLEFGEDPVLPFHKLSRDSVRSSTSGIASSNLYNRLVVWRPEEMLVLRQRGVIKQVSWVGFVLEKVDMLAGVENFRIRDDV